MTQLTKQIPASSSPAETGSLASEMANAHRQMVEFYREHYGLSPEEAAAKLDESPDPEYERRIAKCPPDQFTWLDMKTLADRDPKLAVQRWEDTKQAARDELRSGQRAGKAMEAAGLGPWQRAQFLAIRGELGREWNPRNGIEQTLVDTMSQAYTAYLFWMKRLTMWTTTEAASDTESVREKETYLPRVTEFEAVEQAAAMVDRFNRLFMRTLRALRDLRRYSPTVVVQNAGQVNVGKQQVNVSGRE